MSKQNSWGNMKMLNFGVGMPIIVIVMMEVCMIMGVKIPIKPIKWIIMNMSVIPMPMFVVI